MNKDENKGLADNQEGEFVLNESGTSVSIDPEIDLSEEENVADGDRETKEENDKQTVEGKPQTS